MSKPRYNWWPFALNMIRDYPSRKAEYNALHEQKTTAYLSGMPCSGSLSRTVENVVARLLPQQDQREYDAVEKAIELSQQDANGKLQLDVVNLTIWENSYTIDGAALKLHLAPRTARRYRWSFVMLVGYTYGFLTREEYELLKRRELGSTH